MSDEKIAERTDLELKFLNPLFYLMVALFTENKLTNSLEFPGQG